MKTVDALSQRRIVNENQLSTSRTDLYAKEVKEDSLGQVEKNSSALSGDHVHNHTLS